MAKRPANRYPHLIAVLFFAIANWSAHAAELSTQPLEKNPDTNLIFLSGPIVAGDADKFRKVALINKSGIVVLGSDGGSTLEAIEIGRAIKLLGFSTYALSGVSCNSACALIWLAGAKHYLGTTAKVGFHATYVDSKGALTESGAGNAIVGNYLSSLNLSQEAIIFATSAPPDKLSFITKENSADVGVAVQVVDDKELRSDSDPEQHHDANGASNAKSTQSNDTEKYGSVGAWLIQSDQTLNGGCFLYTSYPNNIEIRIGYDLRPPPTFYLMVMSAKWSSIIAGTRYDVTFQLDSNPPWQGKFQGIDVDGTKGVYIPIPEGAFLSELSKSSGAKVTYNGKVIANLTVPLVGDAVTLMKVCESKHAISEDPFSK